MSTLKRKKVPFSQLLITNPSLLSFSILSSLGVFCVALYDGASIIS